MTGCVIGCVDTWNQHVNVVLVGRWALLFVGRFPSLPYDALCESRSHFLTAQMYSHMLLMQIDFVNAGQLSWFMTISLKPTILAMPSIPGYHPIKQ